MTFDWTFAESIAEAQRDFYRHSSELLQQQLESKKESSKKENSFLTKLMSPFANYNPLKYISQKFEDRNLAKEEFKLTDLLKQLEPISNGLGWSSSLQKDKIIGTTKVGSKTVNVFNAKIVQNWSEDKKSRKEYIVIYNHPIKSDKSDSEAGIFKNNHAVFRRQIAGDHGQSQIEFLKSSLREISVILNRKISPKTPCDAADYIERLIVDSDNQSVVKGLKFEMFYENKRRNCGFFLKNQQGVLVRQGTSFNIGEEFIGIDLTLNDKSNLFFFPKSDLESVKTDFLEFLKNLEEINSPLKSLNSVPKMVKEFIEVNCPNGEVTVEVIPTNSENLIEIKLKKNKSVSVDVRESCGFADSKIRMTLLRYGYLQFIHYYFDSPFLQKENMIPNANPNFRDNFEKALKSTHQIVNKVKMLQAESNKEYNLTVDDVVKIVSKSMGSEGVPTDKKIQTQGNLKFLRELEFASENIFVDIFTNEHGYLIKIVQINNNRINPITTEITAPIANSYDQEETINLQIEEFLNDLKPNGSEKTNDDNGKKSQKESNQEIQEKNTSTPKDITSNNSQIENQNERELIQAIKQELKVDRVRE